MKHLTKYNDYKLFERTKIDEILLQLVYIDGPRAIDQMTELIDDWKININGTDNFGQSALMLSASAGKVDKVRFLITKGAKLTIKNKAGEDFIALSTKKDIREFLKSSDAQRLILSKEPTLYNSFISCKIPLRADIKKEFAFAKSGLDLNLL